MTAEDGERAPLDLTKFRHENSGHADDCPMLTAYDNDGCDCADLLLYEVERLSFDPEVCSVCDSHHDGWETHTFHPTVAIGGSDG